MTPDTACNSVRTTPAPVAGCRRLSMNLDAVFFLELPQTFPCHRLGELFHELVPGDRLPAVVLPHHADALFDRADEEAEGTPDAVLLADARLVRAVHRDKVDA